MGKNAHFNKCYIKRFEHIDVNMDVRVSDYIVLWRQTSYTTCSFTILYLYLRYCIWIPITIHHYPKWHRHWKSNFIQISWILLLIFTQTCNSLLKFNMWSQNKQMNTGRHLPLSVGPGQTCGRLQVMLPCSLAMGVELSENRDVSSEGKSGSSNSSSLPLSAIPSALMALLCFYLGLGCPVSRLWPSSLPPRAFNTCLLAPEKHRFTTCLS